MDILFLSIVLFVVLQVLDVDSTKKVLANGGRELNPIVNFFMKKFGINQGLYLTKIIVIAFIVGLYNAGQLNIVVLTIINIIFLVIVINNYRITKK
jgi:hypothetical protein